MPRRRKGGAPELGTMIASLSPPGRKKPTATTGGSAPAPPIAGSSTRQQIRSFSPVTRTNTIAGSPREGQKLREFTKRDSSGDVYRYHEYKTPGGKRKVFRVGGPSNRKLS